MTRTPLRLLIALACSTPLSAVALGVGQIQVRSALNQALDAEIPLLLTGPGEAAGITARLAPAQAFTQKGIDRLPVLSNLVFTVQTGADGRGLIKVTSKQPIREPLLNFLIQVDWPRGQVMREVAVLLDPPAKAKQRPVPAVPTLAQPQPVAPKPTLAQPTASRPSPPRQPAVVTPAQPTPPPPPVAHRGTATYGPVPFGETLWAIASRVRPDPAVGVPRMMQALLAANPKAFWKPNVNGLRAGAQLRIPSAQEIDPLRFPEQVSRQLAGRQQVPVAPVTPKPASPPPESKPKVRLVPPELAERPQPLQPPAPAALPTRVALAPAGTPSFPIKLKDNHPALRVAGLEELRQRMSTPGQGEDTAAAMRPPLVAAIPPAETPQPRPEAQSPPAAGSSQPEPRLQEILPETIAPPGTPKETGVGPTVAVTATAPAAVRPAGTIPPPTPEVLPPAPVTAATPVPSPAPAPPSQTPVKPFPAAAESKTGGILSGWLNPASLALLGGLGLLLGGGSWYWWRRRARTEEGDEEALAFEKTIPPGTTATAGPMGSPSLAAGKEAAPVAGRRIVRTVPNPVERADLLLAVDSYAEAENLLRQALREEPDNNALRTKLLDVHFANDDAEAFLQEARALYERLEDKADPLWLPVAQLGQKLCPGHELFSQADELLIATKTIKVDLAELEIAAKANGIRQSKPADEPAETTLFSTLNEPTLVSDEQKRDNLAGLDWQLADVDRLTITTGPFPEPPTQPRIRPGQAGADLDRLTITPEPFPEPPTQPRTGPKQAGADLDKLTITAGLFPEPPTQPTTRPEQAGADLDRLTITPKPVPEPPTQSTTWVEKTRVERELEWRLMNLEQPALNPQSLPGREEETEKSTKRPSRELDFEIDSLFANEITHSRLPLATATGETERKARTLGPVQQPAGSLQESPRNRDAALANRPEEPPTQGKVRTLRGEDYTETKLDLAMAYLEMGDPIGARSLLEEVLQEGNADQQQRARAFMEKVNLL